MDFTGAQMVLTLKLISVAVCYQDGMKQDEVRLWCMAGIAVSHKSAVVLPMTIASLHMSVFTLECKV